MPYTLIKGEFHIHYPDNPRNGPEPDGDTLKFRPDNRELIDNLPRPNRPPKFTQTGITTIRFEGIDALETHFSIEGDEFHQQMDLALAARDTLLAQAGFGHVRYFENAPFRVESVENHPIRGYLLSNGLDTFGRTIAFVFTGEHAGMDGARIFVESAMLTPSLNAALLRQGQAYAAFYLTLPSELREHLRAVVSSVRRDRVGLWADATATPSNTATITGVDQLQELVIWPKFFRRLAAFFQDGNTNLAEFDAWLRADPRDRDDRLLLPNRELGNMHDLIEVRGNAVRLTHLPEDVVIVPDDFTLPKTPSESDQVVHLGEGSVRIIGALIDPATRQDSGNETVTVINATDSDIDLAGWSIADNHGRQTLDGVLASGKTHRIRLGGSVRLSNIRDTITVLDPNDRIVDQVSYEARQLPAEGYTMVF